MPEYTATITVPDQVRSYFQILRGLSGEDGQTSAPTWLLRARVTVPAGDEYALGRRARETELALAELTGFPVHARRIFGASQAAQDETAIADPVAVGDGWEFNVNYSHDVRVFFDTITGTAALDYTPGQDTATITFTEDDLYGVGTTAAAIEEELATWGLPATITPAEQPTLVSR